MSTIASHVPNSHKTGISLAPGHFSNRPSGYIDARCVKCHAALDVPAGTEAPHCDNCEPARDQQGLGARIEQAAAPQSADEQRALNYIRQKVGRVSFCEFVQSRRFLHFTTSTSATNQFAEDWG